MSARWRVVDLCDYDGEVTTRRGQLVVAGNRVSLADVVAVLTGPHTSWGASLVALAAQYDIPLLSCDWRGVPISATLPWSSNSRIAARHHAQAELSLPRRKNAWAQIIRAKIRGQAANLRQQAPTTAARLARLAASVRSGDPGNVEAQAARTYWSKISGANSFGRAPGAGEGRNALLDYGYAIVRSYTVRAILITGLSPTLGIWHHNRGNPFGLADDLIEPFRPAVDAVVWALPADASLSERDVKTALVAVTGQPFKNDGGTVATAIAELAQQLARYIEGELPRLLVPAWPGLRLELGDG